MTRVIEMKRISLLFLLVVLICSSVWAKVTKPVIMLMLSQDLTQIMERQKQLLGNLYQK